MTDTVAVERGCAADLGRARDERGTVVEVVRPAAGIVELRVRLPHLAAQVRAGEFAMLRCSDGPRPLLRRPMSVAWVEGDDCGFVFDVVGVGTRLLAGLRPGDELWVLGPLGVGFHLAAGVRRVLCVAGGLGCAPFPLVRSQALAAGAEEVVVLSGAATADRLYPASRLGGGDPRVQVREATDDGSRGHRGQVVDLVDPDLCDSGTALYACGPTAMLAALAQRLRYLDRRPALAQVSLEAPMGCGFGVCLGCAIPLRRRGVTSWALCCRDGPVVDLDAVDWGTLAAVMPPGRR